MRTKSLFVVLSLLLVAHHEAAAQAVAGLAVTAGDAPFQGGTPVFGTPPTDVVVLSSAGAPQSGFVSIELLDAARPVVGAPYTAEAVTTVTQLLADGNRIENERSVRVARDSRGRTRREHQAIFLGAAVAERQAPLVTISDPTTGTNITLDQERQVAIRARTPQIREIRPAAADTAGFTISYRGDPAAGAAAGVAVGAGMKIDWPVVETSLGEQVIEGVRAIGTSTTMTIPAGQIGNQFPLHIVSERWYSPDLQVVVMTRRSDPRVGETVYRLTNIRLGEPPASLFEIPPDFRVEDIGGRLPK